MNHFPSDFHPSDDESHSPVSATDVVRLFDEQRAKLAKLEEDKVFLHAKNVSLRTKLADSKRKTAQLEEELAHASDNYFRESDKREAADDKLNTLKKHKFALAEQNQALKEENEDLLDKLAELRQVLVVHHGLTASDPLQIEDIAVRLQAAVLREKHSPHQTNFTNVFTPRIPMTPIKALENSSYLGVGPTRTLAIMSPAFASMVDGKARLEVNVVINESFVPVHAPEYPLTIMYLGFLYPDGTSLPYIPVRDVIIQYRSSLGKPNRVRKKERFWYVTYAHDFVYLSMPRAVYERLVRAARKAFQSRFHPEKKWNTEVDYDGDRVWIYAGMKPGAKVQGVADGKMDERNVVDALRLAGTDVEGDAMLYMRFTFRSTEDSEPSLCFRFHKLSMETEIKPVRRFGNFKRGAKPGIEDRSPAQERLPKTFAELLNIEQAFQPSSRGALRRLLTCSGGNSDHTSAGREAEMSVL